MAGLNASCLLFAAVKARGRAQGAGASPRVSCSIETVLAASHHGASALQTDLVVDRRITTCPLSKTATDGTMELGRRRPSKGSAVVGIARARFPGSSTSGRSPSDEIRYEHPAVPVNAIYPTPVLGIAAVNRRPISMIPASAGALATLQSS